MNAFNSNDSTYIDELSLIKDLAQGDERAFSELYRRYWNKLFYIASSKLKNLGEAEELVQDVFLDIWRRRDTLKINSSFSSYLAVAVKYKVIDKLAKRATERRYQEFAKLNISSSESSTDNYLNYQELKARLAKSIDDLPQKCRLVFELSRTEGLSQKSIASKLGIAEKTVEAHLSKALRSLRLSLSSLLSFLIFFRLL